MLIIFQDIALGGELPVIEISHTQTFKEELILFENASL